MAEMDAFVRRLSERIETDPKLTAAGLATMAGLDNSTIRQMISKGTSPRLDTARKICAALGETIEEFLAGGAEVAPIRIENGHDAPPAARLIPAYNISASAGQGSLVGYESVDYSLAFPPDYMRRLTSTGPEKLAIIGVVGDSMLPTLKEDDIVMVDRTKTDIDYDGMFVVRIGSVLKVKRLRWGPGREKLIVISDNRERYPPEEYDENDGVEVIGRVIWAGGKV